MKQGLRCGVNIHSESRKVHGRVQGAGYKVQGWVQGGKGSTQPNLFLTDWYLLDVSSILYVIYKTVFEHSQTISVVKRSLQYDEKGPFNTLKICAGTKC